MLVASAQAMTKTESAGIDIFPADNILNIRIDNTTLFPTHSCSTQWVQSMSWTSAMGAGSPYGVLFNAFSPSYGIPINLVNNSVSNVSTYFNEYASFSDYATSYTYPGGGLTVGYSNASWGYPIPTWFTGEPGDATEDKHGIIINYQRKIEYDLFHSPHAWAGASPLNIGCGAIFNLASNQLRGGSGNPQMDGVVYSLPRSGTGVGGNSIAQLLVTPGEMQEGEIKHALYLTVPWAQQSEYLWPARAGYNGNCVAGKHNGYWCPPYGARVRIKSSVDLSHYQTSHPQAYIVLTALKRYGAIINDNSDMPWNYHDAAFTIWGSGDVVKDGVVISDASAIFVRSDLDGMQDFLVTTSNWEFINEQGSMISFNSGQTLTNPYTNETPIVPEYGVDPYLNYTPSSLSGTIPFEVNFTDVSWDTPDNATVYKWAYNNTAGSAGWVEFGDGERNTTYTFRTAGTYWINHTAGNLYGYNTTPEYVWVNVTASGSGNIIAIVYNHVKQFFLLGRLL